MRAAAVPEVIMEIAEAQEFLKHNHRGVLVARKRDGALQMTLVSPVIGADGKVIITARDSTYKVKNIQRNPQVSLLVYGEKFNGSNYIQVDGRAEVIAHPQAMDIVLDWHRQIRGEPANWDDIRRKTLAEGRIAIRLSIEKVGPQNRTHGS
jgi:PPOX class probable F420-dependent enzyme